MTDRELEAASLAELEKETARLDAELAALKQRTQALLTEREKVGRYIRTKVSGLGFAPVETNKRRFSAPEIEQVKELVIDTLTDAGKPIGVAALLKVVRGLYPSIDRSKLRVYLAQLKSDGKIEMEGIRKAAKYLIPAGTKKRKR